MGKKISIQELAQQLHISYEDDYYKLEERVLTLEKEGKVIKIKASLKEEKGRRILYHTYKIKEGSKDDFTSILDGLHPLLQVQYYRKHQEQLRKDYSYLQQLSDYLFIHYDHLSKVMSMNERSFDIFKDEKYLKGKGSALLERLGLHYSDLGIYKTPQPLLSYSLHQKTPQTVLFIENKDTFITLRKCMKEQQSFFLSTTIDSIVYGNGNAITHSDFIDYFSDYDEEWIYNTSNTFYYFGDLDYEGISIFLRFQSMMKLVMNLTLWIPGYERMIDKAIVVQPFLKKKSFKDLVLLDSIELDVLRKQMLLQLLQDDCFIPQEIINCNDLKGSKE